MYRLLIVDDEHHVADALETLFMTQAELELEVYKAYLAKDALSILNRLRIDVLLSDIRMPGIDGFELVENIRRNWPEIRVIFLTAYSEFDILYRVKKYEDVSFLLKTEADERIVEAVGKAISDIEERRRIKLLEMDREELHSMIEQRAASDLVRKALDDMSLMTQDRAPASARPPRVIPEKRTILISLEPCVSGNVSISDQGKRLCHISAIFGSLLGDKALFEPVLLSGDQCLVLIQGKSSADDDKLLLFIREMFDIITESVLDSVPCVKALSLYNAPLEWQSIKEKAELMNAFLKDESRAQGGGRVFTAADEQCVLKDNDLRKWQTRFTHQAQCVIQAIEEGNYSAALEALAPIRQAAEKVRVKHHYPLIILYQKIANALLDRIFFGNLMEKLPFAGGISRLLSVEDFQTWQEAFEYIGDTIANVAEISEDMRADGMCSFLSYIQKYVQEHISEELSLTVLSEKMNYNPSYISRMFRQQSGRTLMEYINAVRMEHAAEELQNTVRHVKDIASDIGMTSTQYFSTVFRKTFGKSPQDYRRQYVNETRGNEHDISD